jgi:hypothetical protein
MNTKILKNKESSAVQAHINMLQGIINRMAANSANCKTWTITILAAMLVLVVEDKICSDKLWICYVPIGLFFFLDCFYLRLEKKFRNTQNDFVDKINNKEDITKDLFAIKTQETESFCQKIRIAGQNFFYQLWCTIKAVFSFSTLPFYGILILIVCFLIK